MLLLVIPLTIIILSFYYPQIKWLQILASFLVISGSIFSIGSLDHLASKGLLEEYFKTFFLTIYNAPSLESKIKLFSDFFNQKINTYVLPVENVNDFKQNLMQILLLILICLKHYLL